MLKNNEITQVLPGKMIGIIGGGQLGRMMAIAAKYMGYQTLVLDPTPNCPTAQVADEQIVAAYDDMKAIRELTRKSDVVTYEFENVDVDAATYIEQQGKLPQGANSLAVTQHRKKEKESICKLDLPVPPFRIVRTGEECEQALKEINFPAVIKTCTGGYDGKGQLKIKTKDDVSAAIQFAREVDISIIEEWISFDKEISVIFTRAQTGEVTFFPVAENDHEDHVLAMTSVPANVSQQVNDHALAATRKIAEKMQIVGTFAIEMFVRGDDIYINEMAPRPHNSGHYTIEACTISQFTQHIRAICGLPLAEIRLLNNARMVNVLGKDIDRTYDYLKANADGFIHLYGKDEPKPKRKMGHATFIADSERELDQMVSEFKEENI